MSTYYETVRVGGEDCQSLTDAGAERARELGFDVDVDPHGCAYAVDLDAPGRPVIDVETGEPIK